MSSADSAREDDGSGTHGLPIADPAGDKPRKRKERIAHDVGAASAR
jgi:hypothetical protein